MSKFRAPVLILIIVLALAALTRPASAAPVLGFTPQPPGTATPTPLPIIPPAETASPTPEPTRGPTNFDPAVSKSANPLEAQVGEIVTFTITITNPNTEATLANVMFTDTLLPQFDFISGSTTSGSFNFDAASRTIVVNISPMPPLSQAIVTIVTRVNELGTPPDVLRNTAHVDHNGRRVTSNTVGIQLIPAVLPEAGYAPVADYTPAPWTVFWFTFILGLSALRLARKYNLLDD